MGVLAALYVVGPWLTIGGTRLFGLDPASGGLRLFGAGIAASHSFAALLAALCIIFSLLWITLALGRLWCGWLCPQSVLIELTESAEKKKALLFHLAAASFAVLFAATSVLYFVPPETVLTRGWEAAQGPAFYSFLLLTTVLYLDAAFVGRRFCTAICPYGKMLTVLTAGDAVDVGMKEGGAEKCIDCSSCLRACPVGVDVRQGVGPDCIRCGRCIDACEEVLKKRGGGIVGFRLPEEGMLKGVLLNPAHLVLLVMAALAASGFVFYVAQSPHAALALALDAQTPARSLSQGLYANFLTGRISGPSGLYSLKAVDGAGWPLELKGDVNEVEVKEGVLRAIRFAAVAGEGGGDVLVRLFSADGRLLAETRIAITRTGANP